MADIGCLFFVYPTKLSCSLFFCLSDQIMAVRASNVLCSLSPCFWGGHEILQDKRGGFARYDADDNGNMGILSAYTSKSGRTYESADISSTLQVIRDDDGAIAQLWNAWDGLMVVDSVTETGYRMAFYLPHQVGAQDATTKLFAVSGSPWRTVVVAGDVANATLQMTDTVLTREPQISRFIYGADGAWSTEQGSGTAKICRHVARELIEQEDEDAPEQYRLVTTLHRGDIDSPDECVAEIWQTGSTGHLCISRTLGYGSPGSLTTLYEYDSEGRRIKEISPSGAVSSFTYDDCGRDMSNNPNVCKACCYIYLSMHSKVWGQVRYAKYSLYQVKITTGNTCSYIRENPGFWNEESLYKVPGEMQGVQDLANPDKIIYEPVIEMTL